MVTLVLLLALIALGVWALVHVWRKEARYGHRIHQAKMAAWNEAHDHMWHPEVHDGATWKANPYFTEDQGR